MTAGGSELEPESSSVVYIYDGKDVLHGSDGRGGGRVR